MTRFVFLISSAALLVACATTGHSDTDIHSDHAHVHGKDCGHTAIAHNDHIDYLHDGHLHHAHNGHVDEHVIEVSEKNPVAENRVAESEHDDHMHSSDDPDHPMVPHGDHMDHLHNGHLHHVHGDHMDEHGNVEVVEG